MIVEYTHFYIESKDGWMKKKISIIVPVYNTYAYLNRCLDSIIAQTYKSLEIICIDDGSTDGSDKIVDQYAAKDSRFVVVHKQNGGESSARNVGLSLATGEYIGFMDCDDWIEPDMYETLLQLLQEYDADLAAVGYAKDYDDRIQPMHNEMPVQTGVISRHELMNYVYHRDAYRAFTGYIWCKLYKREIIKYENGSGIHFDESLRLGGDILFFAEVALKISKAVYREIPLYHYYQRGTSTYHSKDESLWLDILRTYQMVIEKFIANHIEPDIIKWLRRFLGYRAELVAEMAFNHNNKEVLVISQGIMKDCKAAYIETNQEYPERLIEYNKIINYKL